MKIITNNICRAFGLLALACFALSPTANANQPNPPNHPQRRIDFTTNPLQCTPEKVELRGVLQLHFKKQGSLVVPERANFKEFSGTGKSTGRRYMARNVDVEKHKQATFQNGVGAGSFILEFQVIGNPNPPPQGDPNPNKPFGFTVSYKVLYKFDNKVKGLNLGNPKVCCNRNGCLD
jgi:hypothetical protein